MRRSWSREEIESRVDDLKRHHDGSAFVREIKRFNEELAPDEREVMHAVLLQRAQETGGLDVVDRRLEEGGWIKRQLRKLERAGERPPQER